MKLSITGKRKIDIIYILKNICPKMNVLVYYDAIFIPHKPDGV